MTELSDKQKKFADEYLLTLNASAAYRKAGYTTGNDKAVAASASRLLANAKVKAYIEERQAIMQEKTGINQAWVLNRLKDISDRCMQAIPVMIKVDGELIESGEYKFDSMGANRSTELIGKHLGMFSDKVEQQEKPIININFAKASENIEQDD